MWITFDCFGTLVDWNGGFTRCLQDLAGVRAPELVQAYHRHEPQVQRESFRLYREVTRIALERAAQEIGFPLQPSDATILADRWEDLPVFSDTRPTLQRLRDDGWSVAVLTNCDDELFARTQARMDFTFDEIVTAQQVRSYKPGLAHFEEFRRRRSPQRWVHAACSWFHDIEPAMRLQLPRVWIDRDRTGEDPATASGGASGFNAITRNRRAIVTGAWHERGQE